MKLVIAIVQREDSNNLQRAFVQNDFRATKLATSGGFLATPHMLSTGYEITQPLRITVGGATCFVVPVDEFKRF